MRSRLRLCALALAAVALLASVQESGADQVDTQTTEQECRAKIDGALTVAMARSLQRIELGLVALSRGDEAVLGRIADRSTTEAATYDRQIANRDDAVALCGGGR